MEQMANAQINVYWYLSLIAPFAIMISATFWRRRWILWAGVVLSLVATYFLCNFSVVEKWRIRNEIARTDEEKLYASADGANLAFTAFVFAPVEAVIYTSVWGVLGWQLWGRIRRETAKVGLESD